MGKSSDMTDRITRASAAICLLICVLCSPAAVASLLHDDLAAELADSRLENADIALYVKGVEDGEVVFSNNADRPFIPASNQKIITAAAALDLLGGDYEFVTSLWADGEWEDNSLAGDLILKGGGDPTLGSPAVGEDAMAQFDRWARLLKGYGILKITGDIIVDESMFDDEYVHPDWPENQLSRPHSAPVSALSFHDNCLRITVRPAGSVGELARLGAYPLHDGVYIDNSCRTVMDSNIIYVDREKWRIKVGGEVRYGDGGWSGLVTAPEPAVFAGRTFVGVLRRHDIEFSGEVRGKDKGGAVEDKRLLARRRAPLRKVLEVMLVESQNLYAENVLKTLGAHVRGRGTWENGIEAASEALVKRGWCRDSFVIADGSGYSRNNRITARMLCDLLIRMYGEKGAGEMQSLLPAGGREGTLARRFSGDAYAGRVYAKTGYISGVGTLSGYARAESGRLFVFSVMINNFRGNNWQMRQIQDSIVKTILSEG